MTFICNAGPVIALAKIDRLSLLQDLASSVLIPETVLHEVLAKPGPDASRIIAASRSFLNVRPPPETIDPAVQFASRHLDAGEKQVIALASSIHAPVTVVLDDAAGVMEVRRPPDEANRILDGHGVVLAEMGFGQDEVADEPTSVTDIESARPAAVVCELILGQSPGAPSLARGLRDRGVITQIPIQALDVVSRSLDHLRPVGVTRGRVAVIKSREVARERVPGARIRLAVGHAGAGGVDLTARGEVAALEFVAGRVVVGRLLDRGTVGGPGQAKAEAVALDTVVGVAVFEIAGVEILLSNRRRLFCFRL